MVLLGAAALGFFTCGQNNVMPGFVGPGALGDCTFPSACYVVARSGEHVGQCDDCRTYADPMNPITPCRLGYTPPDDGGTHGDGGVWRLVQGFSASITDEPAVCGFYPATPADHASICAAPESVCAARGPACNVATGYCVHASGAPDPCQSVVRAPPQRRPNEDGGSAATYCQFADDRCCPRPGFDGGASDGGALDGGVLDGGPDAAPGDGGAPG